MKSDTLLFFIVTLVTVFTVAVLTEEESDFEKFSKASCNFTLNLLKHAGSKNITTNTIFSPASISVLLSILQQGAKENTLTELENVINLTAEESRNGFGNLKSLKKEKNVELQWGNRCYVKAGLKLDNLFQGIIQQSFDVGVEELDFGAFSSEDLADKINKWVGEVTNDRITNLVDSSVLTPNTIMLLINAIFFKGNWLRPFKKDRTREDKFEMTKDESVKTLFMLQKGKFYADKDSYLGAKWMQLPFENNRFAMIFVLPTKKHRLNQLLEKLTADDLYSIFSQKTVSQVKMRIPKFKLSEKISMVDTLKKLGLTEIFSGTSNLSGMTSDSETLQVSEIIHQANVEIDEKGSTSSAATVVQLLRMGTPNLSFYADQPFLFFIIDVENMIPLFAGKVVNPKSI